MCKNCGCNCECCCESNHPAGIPYLYEPAPEFEALTTHGVLRLSDYRERWLILFSHPTDFTPVCATEYIAFAEIYPELQKRGVELLGTSIESIYAHIAWIRNIEAKTGVKIPFPVIADLNKAVATRYGMLMPGENQTETSRCVFIIDPQGILRAMINYPKSIGRNMHEILRLVEALQTSDKYKVATPANWKPGDKVLLPPPTTVEAAEMRANETEECLDWYLSKKSLD